MKTLVKASRIALVAFGLLLAAHAVQRVAERGRFTGTYSSYGGGPRGARALFLLAEGLGARPARWSQDLAQLPAHGMLIALGGCDVGMARELSRYERKALEDWVSGGGVLLVAGARRYLPESFGVELAVDPGCKAKLGFGGTELGDETHEQAKPQHEPEHDGIKPAPDADELAPDAAAVDAGAFDAGAPDLSDASVCAADGGLSPSSALPGPSTGATAKPRVPSGEQRWAIPVGAPLLGMSIVAFRKPARLVIGKRVTPQVLLGMPSASDDPGDPDVKPLGVVLNVGRGHVVVLAAASMFENHELLQSQGGALFARLLRAYAPSGPVLFDEYHLGVGERRSLMQYLRRLGAMPIAFALLFIVGIWLWRAGARFGAVAVTLPAPPSGSASFVAALGRLYQSAADPTGTVDTIVRQALARIAAHHHVPAASARKLEQALRERSATIAADAVVEIEAQRREAPAQRNRLAALVARIDAATERAVASEGPARAGRY